MLYSVASATVRYISLIALSDPEATQITGTAGYAEKLFIPHRKYFYNPNNMCNVEWLLPCMLSTHADQSRNFYESHIHVCAVFKYNTNI